MQNQLSKASSADVIPAIVNFIDAINQQGNQPDLSSEMQIFCKLFLE